MFYKMERGGYIEVAPGVFRKTLTYGANTLFTEFRLGGGKDLPMHSHPQEQTGYLVSGMLQLVIGEQRFDAHPGDSWCIPGDVMHGAHVIEDAVAIEVFSPVRTDYLPK